MWLGDVLRKARKAMGLTQAELAARLEVSESAVRMWELGQREPDIQTLRNLSLLLGIPADVLLGLETARPTAREDEVANIMHGLPPEVRDELLRYARYLRVRETLEGPDKESSATSERTG
ncbi:MAG TPA: helix-turn-helix transcriptional regulator [Firmicutes bacterium]|nr:helix-turn-helix transcriptional regulator [Bacillota bacterium]